MAIQNTKQLPSRPRNTLALRSTGIPISKRRMPSSSPSPSLATTYVAKSSFLKLIIATSSGSSPARYQSSSVGASFSRAMSFKSSTSRERKILLPTGCPVCILFQHPFRLLSHLSCRRHRYPSKICLMLYMDIAPYTMEPSEHISRYVKDSQDMASHSASSKTWSPNALSARKTGSLSNPYRHHPATRHSSTIFAPSELIMSQSLHQMKMATSASYSLWSTTQSFPSPTPSEITPPQPFPSRSSNTTARLEPSLPSSRTLAAPSCPTACTP